MTLSETASDLPDSWAWVTLDSVASGLYRYPTFYGMEHLDEGVPVIRGEHIRSDGTISHEWLDYWYVSEEISAEFPHTILEPGDLVMSVRGTIGKMGLVDKKLHAAQISPNCLRITLPRSFCVPEYILHYLKSVDGQSSIQGITNSTTIRTIKASLIAKAPIPLAPLSEQRRIVEKIEELFTKLDAGVRSLEQARKQLKSYRRSVLKAAVEGELSREWREAHREELEPASELLDRILQERREKFTGKKYKEPASPDTSKLPSLPNCWIWTTVDTLLVLGPQNGLYLPQSAYGMGNPILRIDDFQIGWSRSSVELRVVAASESETEKYSLKEGDLLINRVNSMTHLGKTLVVKDRNVPALFESNMMRARTTDLVSVDYLQTYLGSDKGRGRLIADAKQAVNQASINQSDVGNTSIPLPPIKEQHFIIEEVERRLSVVDKLEATVQENLKQAAGLRQSILKQAFAGELVPQDPDDEPASVLLARIRSGREATKPKARKKGVKAKREAPADVRVPELFPERGA